jgi:hypothetical protein
MRRLRKPMGCNVPPRRTLLAAQGGFSWLKAAQHNDGALASFAMKPRARQRAYFLGLLNQLARANRPKTTNMMIRT